MSVFSILFPILCTIGDFKRDRKLKEPQGIRVYQDISYAEKGKYNRMDIYMPESFTKKVPVIVSIHGGGYVYGTKKSYRYYGMNLAEQGFAVVNMNYHLAPKNRFPIQLKEINQVMEWIAKHAEEYCMDRNNVFLVGDSAGAQMTSHYAAIYSNLEFAAKFPFQIPEQIKIRAIALNCGMYDISSTGEAIMATQKMAAGMRRSVMVEEYLGEKRATFDDMLRVKEYITSDFPPTYVMSAYYDFLKEEAEPMYQWLKEKGVEARLHIYGEEGQKHMGHIFHCNMNLEEAKQCNYDECHFFKKYCKTT